MNKKDLRWPPWHFYVAIFLTLMFAGLPSHIAIGLPAPSINSVCEPGGCGSNQCDYLIYLNAPRTNDNTTLVKNCRTGTNDYQSSDTAGALQTLFNYLATVPNPSPEPPAGIGQGPQFHIDFATGYFYIPRTITINSGAASGFALAFKGEGQDKTALILSTGINANMFNVLNIGDKFEVSDMKFVGNCNTAYGFQFSGASREVIFTDTEMRDFKNADILFSGTGNDFNIFSNAWFISQGCGNNSPGVWVGSGATGYKDFRFVGCKFQISNPLGFLNDASGTTRVNFSGSNFDGGGIGFRNNPVTDVVISGNLFFNAANPAINFYGIGLAALTDTKTLIEGNLFDASSATNTAITVADYVDGVSIKNNDFVGYTPSSIVPINLVQTHQKQSTFISNNRGYNPQNPSAVTAGASIWSYSDNDAYPEQMYLLTIGGISAWTCNGIAGWSITAGSICQLAPYQTMSVTWATTAPVFEKMPQ